MRSGTLGLLIVESDYSGEIESWIDAIYEDFSVDPDVDVIEMEAPTLPLIEHLGWLESRTAPSEKEYEAREKSIRRSQRCAEAQRRRQQRERANRAYFRYWATYNESRAYWFERERLEREAQWERYKPLWPIIQRLRVVWRRLFDVPGGVDMTPYYHKLLMDFQEVIFAVSRHRTNYEHRLS